MQQIEELQPEYLQGLADKVEDITDGMILPIIYEEISESEELLAWKFYQAEALLKQANALLNQLVIESKGK